MKYYFYIITFISCFKLCILDCIPNKNCLKDRGECINNICHCYEEFWTLKTNEPNNSTKIYCNYERQNRFKPFILEIFLPGVGHLIMKKYKLCIIKLILLFTPLILIIIGFILFKDEKKNENVDNKNKNEEELKLNQNPNDNSKESLENNKDNKKEFYYSDEGTDSANMSGKLHIANQTIIPINCCQSFLIFLVFIFVLCFLTMHIVDLIKYGFAYYRDENNVPFLPIL